MKNRLGGMSWIGGDGEDIGPSEIDKSFPTSDKNLVDGKKIRSVSIDSVEPDPDQPRKNIDSTGEDIQALAESFKRVGMREYPTVRRVKNKYIIVSGERRYWSAKIAGFEKIFVFVEQEEKSSQEIFLTQLEENLQRVDLNYFDEAGAYQRLRDEFGMEQKAIAQKTGKGEDYISRMMKINNIAQEIKEEILLQKLDVAHRLLFDIARHSQKNQLEIWELIKDNPTIASFKKAEKMLNESVSVEEKVKDNEPDIDIVWTAFRKMMRQDKKRILEFITPKKLERLLEEFTE